jgi:ankyrin repeat protein
VIEMLVRVGADVDARDGWGNTPLARAVVNSRGRGEAIVALLKAGADPRAENDHGNSPYSTAERVTNYDLKQLFAD